LLEKAGHEVLAVDLPSAGGGGDLAADAAVVRAAIDRSDEPTVVVAHSYGGIPTTEAATGAPQVRHLVYLCAFMLDEGESLLGALQGQSPPWIAIDEANGVSRVPDPVPVFYGDVPAADAERYAGRLSPQSLKSFADPLGRPAWRDVASTYVLCTDDQAIPYPAQQAMSGHAGTTHTLESSHSPFLSHAEEVAGIVDGVSG
jgi:pimeloyl-ACP methyl ester carboxylesterase